MKQRITANGELDLITRDELRGELDRIKAWQVELNRGVGFRDVVMAGDVSGGNVSIFDDGPADSMAWGITRVSVAPGPTLGANGLQLYFNDSDSLTRVRLARLVVGDLFLGDHGLVVKSGTSLRLVGTGISIATQVVVTMTVKEVPIQQLWTL
jgi:hypothetical protein